MAKLLRMCYSWHGSYLHISAIGLTPHAESHVIYLSFVGVSESCRNLGFGKLLLERAIALAKEKGFKSMRCYGAASSPERSEFTVRLTTLPGILESACHLYSKYGFKEISAFQSEHYYVATLELNLI